MAMWIYKAEGYNKKIIEGKLQAESKEALASLLLRRKLNLVSARKEPVQIVMPWSNGVPRIWHVLPANLPQ
jgi:type II secretory pathway component PulF